MTKAGNHTETSMLKGIQSGDTKALTEVYTQFFPDIKRYVMRNQGKIEDAEDIFQEAMLIVFDKLRNKEFSLNRSLGAYIYGIGRKLWLKRLQKMKLLEYANGDERDFVVVDLTEEEEIKGLRERIFFKHLASLDPSCRQVLTWFFQKVPMKEIAVRLDTSEAYIKKKKFKCKSTLVTRVQSDPLYQELIAS